MNKNLIALCGRMGSGKDTVEKIWQILEYDKTKLHNPKEGTKIVSQLHEDFHNLEVTYNSLIEVKALTYGHKKLSSLIKQLTALLIGCSVEKLEDRIFKSTPLPKRFWVYKQVLSGKIIAYRDFDSEPHKDNYELIKRTPRDLMQLLGTPVGKRLISPTIWREGLFEDWFPEKKWIFTDVRDWDDMKEIEIHQGFLIKVVRLKTWDEWLRDIPHLVKSTLDQPSNSSTKKIPFIEFFEFLVYLRNHNRLATLGTENDWRNWCESVDHENESSVDTKEFSYIIYNSGGLQDLYAEVYRVRNLIYAEDNNFLKRTALDKINKEIDETNKFLLEVNKDLINLKLKKNELQNQ